MTTESLFFKNNSPQEQLVEFLLGPIRWQIVEAAFELSIFDNTINPTSSTHLAQALSLAPEPTKILLDALCSLNILDKNNALYQLNSAVAPYVISDSACSMRDMLLHLRNVKHADKTTIKETIKTGHSQHISSSMSNSNFWDDMQRSLYSFQSSIGNNTALTTLYDLPQWPNAQSILDLGAGSECLSQAITTEQPDMTVSLFDLPKCAEKITQHLSHETTINVIGGDFNSDDIGGPYDIVWASMSLYYANSLHDTLDKIKSALNKGGVFISLHEDLRHQRTLPEPHITGRFLPAISGNDLSFADGVIAKTMKEVGFTTVSSHFISTAMGEMRVDIGFS